MPHGGRGAETALCPTRRPTQNSSLCRWSGNSRHDGDDPGRSATPDGHRHGRLYLHCGGGHRVRPCSRGAALPLRRTSVAGARPPDTAGAPGYRSHPRSAHAPGRRHGRGSGHARSRSSHASLSRDGHLCLGRHQWSQCMSLRAPRFAVDMAVAFQFLTRLPVPQVPFAPDGLARAVKFFPLVGLVIGSGAALLQKVLSPHLGRLSCALVVLLYLVLITGCLHEDGLADVADSLGGWTQEKLLAILHDTRIGTFGATALALSLLSRGALLAELPLERFTAYLV